MTASSPDASGGSIVYLSPVRESEFPSEWYELSSVEHFWFVWRLRATLRLMAETGVPRDAELRVLDVGGGAGLLRDQLESATRWSVDLAELNPAALAAAGPGRGRALYYDVGQREETLRGAYDVALLFDVLEHVEDTRGLLASIAHHLRPGGWLLVNVPALPSLMSAYDRAAGHLRRYTPGSLRREFLGLDYEIVSVRHWGLSLVALLLLRKWLLGRTPTATTIRRGFAAPSRLAHAGLRRLMATETAVLPLSPIGASLLLAARAGRAGCAGSGGGSASSL